MNEITSTDSIIEVNIESIRVSPFQPRRVFAPSDLDELVSSLKSVGLIHPPVVREIRRGDKVLYYELIAGERRWRALQLAGYKTIPVILKQVITDNVAAEATLIENIQRVNLNPLEMAEAFKKLISVFGLTQDKVAARVGKKRSTVANYLRLLSLSTSIREEISSGGLSLGHAKVILSLDNPQLREILSKRIVKGKLAVREAELLAKQLQNGGSLPEKMPTYSGDYTELQERLSISSGYKVTVRSRGKRREVAFLVQNDEELQQLEKWLERS